MFRYLRKNTTAVIAMTLLTILMVSAVVVETLDARYKNVYDSYRFELDIAANYHLTFNPNGGMISSPSSAGGEWTEVSPESATKTVEVGKKIGALPVVEKEGYMFDGWQFVPGGEYVAVDGLTALQEGTTKQYLDTEYKPTANTKIECTFKVNDGERDTTHFYSNGQWFSIYGSTTVFSLTLNYVGDTTGQQYSYQYGSYEDYKHTVDYEKHHFIQDKNLFYQDGELIHTGIRSWQTPSQNLKLFNRSSGENTYAKATIYDFKIWDGDELKRDFIPVRKADGSEYGMYDRVSGEFFGNAGTGAFTGGTDIGADADEYTVISAPSDQILYAKWKQNVTVTFDAGEGSVDEKEKTVYYGDSYGELPVPVRENYEFVGWSYIPQNLYRQIDSITAPQETTGGTRMNQWIDTGFRPTGNTKVECEYKINDGEKDPHFYLNEWFSIYGSSTDYALTLNYINPTQQYSYQYGGFNDISHTVDYERHHLIQDRNRFYQDEELIYTSGNTFTTSGRNLDLFTRGTAGSDATYAKMSLYYFKIWDNNILHRDMVPVICNEDGASGMYDRLNDVFYPNAGTGAFIPGDDNQEVISKDTEVFKAKDHTLYAVWKKTGTSVTFDANGGSIASPSAAGEEWKEVTDGYAIKKVTIGEKYGELPTPERDGYTFIGWSEYPVEIPAAYQNVEYIQNTSADGALEGDEYIDTGLIPDISYEYDITASIHTDTTTNNSRTIFGSRNNTFYGVNIGNGANDFYGGNSETRYDSCKYTTDRIYHSHIKDCVLTLSDENRMHVHTFSNASTVYGADKPLYLLALNDNGTAKNSLTGTRVYGAYVKNGEDMLINMLPVRIKETNEYGMYDTVSGSFFGNASGQGAFTGGNVIDTSVTESTVVELKENHTLYAVWEKDSKKLTLNLNDESERKQSVVPVRSLDE